MATHMGETPSQLMARATVRLQTLDRQSDAAAFTDLRNAIWSLSDARGDARCLKAGIHWSSVFPGFECDEPDAIDWHARQFAEGAVEDAARALRELLERLDNNEATGVAA